MVQLAFESHSMHLIEDRTDADDTNVNKPRNRGNVTDETLYDESQKKVKKVEDERPRQLVKNGLNKWERKSPHHPFPPPSLLRDHFSPSFLIKLSFPSPLSSTQPQFPLKSPAPSPALPPSSGERRRRGREAKRAILTTHKRGGESQLSAFCPPSFHCFLFFLSFPFSTNPDASLKCSPPGSKSWYIGLRFG